MHKIHLRWYLTPQRMAKFHPQSSSKCWRECNHIGTLSHILWSCPALITLWKEVECFIQDICHLPIKLTPQLAILNLNTELLPPPFRLVITHILLATRLLITRRWQTTLSPTLTEVITLVHSHYAYESIISKGKPSYSKIHNLWYPWSNWYSQKLT